MKVKYTSQKGFVVPILQQVLKINKGCSLNQILSGITSNGSLQLTEFDLDKIDLNEKFRYEYVTEHLLKSLVMQGFLYLENNLYSITDLGFDYLKQKSDIYNHSDFLIELDTSSENKYIYTNISSQLFENVNKKITILGFNNHNDKYVDLLNDYLDFIELNFPTIHELCDFLKNNYNISSNNDCINIVNVLRLCGLIKVITKNLTLTKLGEWYVNSYDNIALFKIFSNLFAGFIEIFETIALNKNISPDNLKSILSKSHFEWAETEQFDLRINWLISMKLITNNNSELSLTNKAQELSQFLGLVREEIEIEKSNKVLKENIENQYSANEYTDEHFSSELDDIIEDMINEAGLSIENANNSSINLSQQERNFLLDDENISENLSEDIEIIEDLDELDDIKDLDNVEISETIESDEEFEFEPDFEDNKSSNVIKIINKNIKKGSHFIKSKNSNENSSSNLLIEPRDVLDLVYLPDEIIFKIISAMSMGKHIILTGPHGSGKTSIAVALAKIANTKKLNSGYILTSAEENWTSSDTIGNLVETNGSKFFKEGYILKSIKEDKWLIIDELSKCNTNICFNDFINALHDHDIVLSYMHENYKNIEILSNKSTKPLESNQYFKSKNWRIIATMDTVEKQNINFSSSFIRRFAFIDIGVNDYSSLIDKYFIKNDLKNDLLKSKIKTIFSEKGLIKYKNIGISSIFDLIQYISIRNDILSEHDNIHTLLAEGLELYILPQLQSLSNEKTKEIQAYLIDLFEGHDTIKKSISKAL